jgi:hypothetical protein
LGPPHKPVSIIALWGVVDSVTGNDGAQVANVREAGGKRFGGKMGIFGRAGGKNVRRMRDQRHTADVVVVTIVDELETDVAVLAADGAKEAFVRLEGEAVTNPVVAIESGDTVRVDEGEKGPIGGDDRLGELGGIKGASERKRAAVETERTQEDEGESGNAAGDHSPRLSLA